MGSTTFGYDKREDRVWMSFDNGTPRLWLTRRIVSHLLGAMLRPFESAAPGAQGGAQAITRVALEHEIAMQESLPGENSAPLKMAMEHESDRRDESGDLCIGLTASFDAEQCRLVFSIEDGQRSLHLNRIAMHRWLRGLHMVAQHALWELPAPDWLLTSCLPETVRAMVQDASRQPPAPSASPGDAPGGN